MKFTTGSAPIPPEGTIGRELSLLRVALAALPVGEEYIEILLDDTHYLTMSAFQSRVAVTASNAMGKGNYTTRRNPDRTGVRIWRTA